MPAGRPQRFRANCRALPIARLCPGLQCLWRSRPQRGSGPGNLRGRLAPTRSVERTCQFEALALRHRAKPEPELRARLGVSEGALRVAVHRLRQRYRELLRAEVAETVAGPNEVEEELRYLFHALSG
jgi:hypothetical protein